MDIASKITELRKQKNWSQYELSKQIQVSREIIGRYERGEAMPSLEIAQKMANAFGVSLDYLAGSIQNQLDKITLNRVENIDKLPFEEKNMVYSFLDAFITKSKLQGIL